MAQGEAPPPLVGRGRYRPLRLLRETLFGAAYLCEDTWRSLALESPDAVEFAAEDARCCTLLTRHRQPKQQRDRLVVLKHVHLAVAAQALARGADCESEGEAVREGVAPVDSSETVNTGPTISDVDTSAPDDHLQTHEQGEAGADEAAGLHRLQPKRQQLDDPRQERAAARLLRHVGGHPNVVQYLDMFLDDLDDFDGSDTATGGCADGADGARNSTDDGHDSGDGSARSLFFVLEYCEDGDLHEYLMAQHGPGSRLSPFDAMSVLAQVASGVAFVHALGLAHRDISLENVLLDRGVCKLSDFGLSASALQPRTERVGKAYYMAPEVVSASATAPYDARAADVWSLGITFFILLTGSPLVLLASHSEVSFAAFERHGVRAVLEAWGRVEALPQSVTQLLEGMLAVDPSKRLTIQQVLRHRAFDEWEASFAAHDMRL